MHLKVEYGNSVICLPGKVAELVAGCTECELRVLVYLLSDNRLDREIDSALGAKELNIDELTFGSALSFWRGAGVLSTSWDEDERARVLVKESAEESGVNVITLTSNDSPHYTGKEIEKLFADQPQLQSFIDECQHVLGRMFTPHEINKILALREYHGLDCEYLLILCGYCKRIERATVPYLDKTARGLINEGVTTVAALEEKLIYLEQYRSTEEVVRRLCGWSSRKVTAKEKRFIDKWIELSVPIALIELAYEVTVNNTGAPSMPYMNKVLTNWNEAGYKTSEDVFAGLEAYSKKKSMLESSGGSFDTDEFFEAALKRSLEKHKASADTAD